jgi:hypothetical protein
MKNIFALISGLLVIIIMLFLIRNTDDSMNNEVHEFNLSQKEIGLKLIEKHCYVCHSVNSNSHDEIIAPPLAAVKWRYSRQYSNKEEFVSAMVDWIMDPKLGKSIMPGAVDKFKVMPKQPFDKTEIVSIVNYIYDNPLEEPVWFEEHQKDMHGKNAYTRNNK